MIAPWLCLSLTLSPASAITAASGRRPPVSELLINASDGRLRFSSNPDVVRAPASLTKMMTLYLVFDALAAGTLDMSDRIAISRHAASQQPSRLGLKAGTKLSLRTAISAVAVNSANDVAVALAERLGGNEATFAKRMTRKARSLGMANTRFANATGLTSVGNRTTARDMGKLSLALLHDHPEYYAIFATRSLQWDNRTLRNHNHLLGHVRGVDGIKTGYTADAGYNLAASAKRRGQRVIVIVMGESSADARDVRVSNLVEKGFIRVAGPLGAVSSRFHSR